MQQDITEITRATHEWVAAFEAGDVPGTLTLLTEDAVLIPPNQSEVSGVGAIEAWVESMFEGVTVREASTTVDSVRVAGDWAVSHGVWHMTMSVGDATVADTTRYVLIWERRGGGPWKIVRDIWNSALPSTQGD